MARWHRKKARRAVSHRRTPTGEPCSVRGANGRFDYSRNRAFERRARSAPTGAAHSSADSCSSAMGSIPAGGGVCGRGRARKQKVRTWGAEARQGPEHMTRAGACPRNCGRQRARSAPKHNTPGRGYSFAKGLPRSARPFMDRRRGLCSQITRNLVLGGFETHAPPRHTHTPDSHSS